jgi:hypothetical protein
MASVVAAASPRPLFTPPQLERTAMNSMDAAPAVSRKRRRSIEPVDSSKILALPLALSPRAMGGPATSPVKLFKSPSIEDGQTAAASTAAADHEDASDPVEWMLVQRRSLMSLSLQLKLKMLLVEAWASDMNAVVMERNLFAVARELAGLWAMGALEEHTCIRFLELAHARLAQLLEAHARRESLQVQALPLWNTAVVQASEERRAKVAEDNDAPPSPLSVSDFSGSATDSTKTPEQRELAVLWKAMSVARDRGAQLWHENKPEQALPFLLAADSYMKRFTLKHQRLQIDRALLEALESMPSAAATSGKSKSTKRVAFAEEHAVMGVADVTVDRSPIAPTKPSKLESLLLRTAREFPTPSF